MLRFPSRLAVGLVAAFGLGLLAEASAQTRTVPNGLEVHETEPILRSEAPAYFLTKEACTTAEPGWKIVASSVTTQVVTARMMDPSGDPDWKVEKAEARTRLDQNDTKICLAGYCQGPFQFQCEIQVRASWQEVPASSTPKAE